MPSNDTVSTRDDIVAGAERLARDYHYRQTYGAAPYADGHLAEVVRLLTTHTTDPTIRAAGWMHDALEDTAIPPQEIVDTCGQDVLRLVEAVTDGIGVNRAARKRSAYAQILSSGSRAILLKLCDRQANLTACVQNKDRRLRMYQREHAEFRDALYDRVHPEDPLYSAVQAVQAAIDSLIATPPFNLHKAGSSPAKDSTR